MYTVGIITSSDKGAKNERIDKSGEAIKEIVEKYKKQLAQDNIYSIGRYGSWTYCSIEDNIIEAKDLAEKLLIS